MPSPTPQAMLTEATYFDLRQAIAEQIDSFAPISHFCEAEAIIKIVCAHLSAGDRIKELEESGDHSEMMLRGYADDLADANARIAELQHTLGDLCKAAEAHLATSDGSEREYLRDEVAIANAILKIDVHSPPSPSGEEQSPGVTKAMQVFERGLAERRSAKTDASGRNTHTPRFEKTYCSQCGQEFGPGDIGYSHCHQHQPPSGEEPGDREQELTVEDVAEVHGVIVRKPYANVADPVVVTRWPPAKVEAIKAAASRGLESGWLREQVQRALAHFDMRSELYTNDADVAAGLADILRLALITNPPSEQEKEDGVRWSNFGVFETRKSEEKTSLANIIGNLWRSAEDQVVELARSLKAIAEENVIWTDTNHHYYAALVGLFQQIAHDALNAHPPLQTETPAPTLPGEGGETKCYDCKLPYDDEGFADLVVPHDVWAKISPTGHEGGLLCPNCLVRRAEKAGLTGVTAKFTSGPFAPATVDGGEPSSPGEEGGTEQEMFPASVGGEESRVMRTAREAAEKVASWSPEKQDYARRVSGSSPPSPDIEDLVERGGVSSPEDIEFTKRECPFLNPVAIEILATFIYEFGTRRTITWGGLANRIAAALKGDVG